MENNTPSPSHLWGDTDFDWDALGQAVDYVAHNTRRWGRIQMHTKEKYGTLRINCHYGFTIHGSIWPGYCFKHRYCPQWLWSLDLKLQNRFYDRFINPWFISYQKWVYKQVFKRAVKKWPHIEAEILDEYDWYLE